MRRALFRAACLAFALAPLSPHRVLAQMASQESRQALQAAQGSLQAGDFAAARATLERLTAQEPDNGIAWALLGYALRNLQDFPAAVAAYEKAVPLRPEAGGTLMQGGMAQAQAGHLDRENILII